MTPKNIQCFLLLMSGLTNILILQHLPSPVSMLPLEGCRTSDIDLLFIADGFLPRDDQEIQTSFFRQLLALFLSPDENRLTRLQVAMASTAPNGLDVRSSFQDHRYLEELMDVAYSGNNSTVEIIAQESSYHTYVDLVHGAFHQIQGNRSHAAHVVVMVLSNYSVTAIEDVTGVKDTRQYQSDIEFFLVLVGFDGSQEEMLAKQKNCVIKRTFKQILTNQTLSMRLCNECRTTSFTLISHNPNDSKSCYFIDKAESLITWHDASDRCKLHGGQLVSIESLRELDFLKSHLNNITKDNYFLFHDQFAGGEASYYHIYIGLIRGTDSITRRFRWLNGHPLITRHWLFGHPDGGPIQRCGMWLYERSYWSGNYGYYHGDYRREDSNTSDSYWSGDFGYSFGDYGGEGSNVSDYPPIYPETDPDPSGRDGWTDIGCGNFMSDKSLCEIVIPRASGLRENVPNIILSPASNNSTRKVLAQGEFIIFQDSVVSISASALSEVIPLFIEGVISTLELFDCNEPQGKRKKIPYSYVCDHIRHCDSGRDEGICRYRRCDATSEFTCRSLQCVPAESRCDAFRDCYDGSDEEDCEECKGARCCDGTCLPKHYFFDGEIDCSGCEKVFVENYASGLSNDETISQFQLLADINKYDYNCAFICNRTECVFLPQMNDGFVDCQGPEGPLDETIGKLKTSDSCYHPRFSDALWSPHCVYIKDRYGGVLGCTDMSHLQNCEDFACPEGYVKCPSSYCIPYHFLHDGIQDCLMGEDEEHGEERDCKGHFACWNSKICLHLDLVCDGHPHCPSGDDELNCHVSCVDGFQCIAGTVIVADFDKSEMLESLTFIDSQTRYLDLSGVDLSTHFTNESRGQFINMIEIRMSNCKIADVFGSFAADVSRLDTVYELDLSYNLITEIPRNNMFQYMTNLRVLNLSQNLLLSGVADGAFQALSPVALLKNLDLSFTCIKILSSGWLEGLSGLKKLNVSHSHIDVIDENTFHDKLQLDALDLRGNQLSEIHPNSLTGLTISFELHTDNYKLCCPQIRGSDIPAHTCNAPEDAVSSCTDLVREDTQRVLLWVIGIVAVLGNVVVIAYRLLLDRGILKKPYGLFVTNLSISDLLMGVYLLIISAKDVHFRGVYVWHEKDWRHSALCQTAGFLSTISSETSAFFIVLVTLDRFLVFRFPFGQYRFSKTSMIISCLAAWCVGFTLALIPVLPQFENWSIYSTNGMCLGLPFTTERVDGQGYPVFVFIVLNFIMFLVIACGQYLIYGAVSRNKITKSGLVQHSARRIQDIMIAKQLSLVALSDFMCWFPVGLMGLLALNGYDLGRDAYAWSAVLVLPINSALNPFLYTVPILFEKWENFKSGHSKQKPK